MFSLPQPLVISLLHHIPACIVGPNLEALMGPTHLHIDAFDSPFSPVDVQVSDKHTHMLINIHSFNKIAV